MSDKIHGEQQAWLSANAQLDRLYHLQETQSEDALDQEAEKLNELVKRSANHVDRTAGNLPVLLATRSLIFDSQGQTKLADLDRLWLKRIGVQPQNVYASLPSDVECMLALGEVQAILDTRGFIQTQLPWQSTWTHPSGDVMQLEDQSRFITYGSYELALQDLDLAIAAAEVRLLALNSDAVNRIEYSVDSIRIKKVSGVKLVAILREHRRQAHMKAGQIEAAQQDQERIEELGVGDNLF